MSMEQHEKLRRTKVERIRVQNPTGKKNRFDDVSLFNVVLLFSSPTHSTNDRTPYTINSIITSPTKITNVANSNVQRARGTTSNAISPVSNILSTNGENLTKKMDVDLGNSSRHSQKRRSVSAATSSATTFLSLTGKTGRTKRTNSSSAIHSRSKSSINVTNSKRAHSPSSINLSGTMTKNNTNQRKKQKFSHYWALFGKSEQKLVLIDVKIRFDSI